MTPALGSRQLASIRDADGRVNIWEGAIRSGKTIGSILRFVMFVAANRSRSGEIVIIGRTRDSAWRNIIAPAQDPAITGAVADQVEGNYGAPYVTILGRRVFVLGASDAKAEKVLRGLTVLGAYVDEVTTLPEEFFVQLLGRMSPPGARLFGTTNPDNPAHWLKVKFLDRVPVAGRTVPDDPLLDWRVFSFTLDDNPSLTDAYKASLKAEFTGLWYRRFILGEWVAAEGAVFADWDPDRHVVAAADAPPPQAMRAIIATGIDYGTTNPTAAILLGIGPDRRLWALDEWRVARRQDKGLTLGATVDRIREWTDASPYGRPQFMPVDPSAADLRTELATAGLVPMAADNDVTYGVRKLASLLAQDRLRIVDRCPYLIAEMPGYSWDDKAAQKGEDKPVKIADHSIDALRYAAISTETIWARHITDR